MIEYKKKDLRLPRKSHSINYFDRSVKLKLKLLFHYNIFDISIIQLTEKVYYKKIKYQSLSRSSSPLTPSLHSTSLAMFVMLSITAAVDGGSKTSLTRKYTYV